MPDLETRVYNCETDIKRILDRLGKVEDKSTGAWRTIAEQRSELLQVKQDISDLKEEVGSLSDRIGGMEVDMKEQKMASGDMKRMLRVLIAMVAVMGVVSVGFFVYIWRHDADLARSILSLGATLAGAVA